MHIQRVNLDDLAVSGLPDGSRIIVNSKNETVFALNATAGAAWDACNEPTTLAMVTEAMRQSFDPNVTEELAEAAVMQLHEKSLVVVKGDQPKATRREVLAGLSAVALPLVVSLTVGEQRAHALNARSNNSFGKGPRPSVPKHESLNH
jgi:Coenzyme PQQ synthesis protein D (PqqD)